MNAKRLVSRSSAHAKLAVMGLSLLAGLGILVSGNTGDFPTGAARGPFAQSGTSASVASPSEGDVAGRARLLKAYGRMPLSFEPNRGQTDSRVQYLARGRGYTLFLASDEAVLALPKPSAVRPPISTSEKPAPRPRSRTVLRMQLVGASPASRLAGLEELPGKSNYFLGKDPAKWRTGIPHYRRVGARDVYPGIDLVYYDRQSESHGEPFPGRQLEFDFVVAASADPRAIRLAFSGADSLRLDGAGNLVVRVAGGELLLDKPVAFQPLGAPLASPRSPQAAPTDSPAPGDRRYLDVRFVLRGTREVAFNVPTYDPTLPLVIDPVLSYSTYLGGVDIDAGKGIAVDSLGSAFIAGETDSLDFPTAHPLQPNAGGPFDFPDDLFVSKLSADGSTLIYSTYLGGLNRELAGGIAVDTFGNAYITGTTLSEDYPATIGAADPGCGNDGLCDAILNKGRIKSDGFITKLNSEGSALVYSSFIGHLGPPVFEDIVFSDGTIVSIFRGNAGANDRAFGIAVDGNGNAYVVGSTDFPNLGPLVGGGIDAYLFKLSATGSSFLMVADFGGLNEDQALAVAADANGNAYVTGLTYSANFPTAGAAFQGAFGGNADAFVSKFATSGGGFGALTYSTYLGGNGNDQGNGIALDLSALVYVAGVTSSNTVPFPVKPSPGAFQTACTLNTLGNCDGDVFVAKLDTTQGIAANTLVYSTYIGGTNADFGGAIAVDTVGNAYLTGFSNSVDYPTTVGGFQPLYGGGNTDAFVTKLDPAGATLVYSSYLGGTDAEYGAGIAVDIFGNAFVTGQTCSIDFPTSRPLQVLPGGNCDAFVAQVLVGPDISLSFTSLTFPPQVVNTPSQPQTITVVSSGDAPLTITDVVATGDFAETDGCEGATFQIGESCTISVTFTPTATGSRSGTLTITHDGPGGSTTVNMTGTTSVPSAVLSTTTLVFASQPLGTESDPMTLTLRNTGTAPLAVNSIAASPTLEFGETDDCGLLVGVNSSCTIRVTFKPAAGGERNGTLTITDNAPGSPRTVTLTGSGSDFAISVTPASATLAAGGSTEFTVSVIPSGGFSQTVTITCGGAPRDATCLATPNTVTPQGTNPANTQVVVTTRVRAEVPPGSGPAVPPGGAGLRWMPWIIAFLLSASLLVARRRARVALAFTGLLVLTWAACAGGSTVGVPRGTPAGTFPLTITGTAGGSTQTATVDLTVN